MALGFRVTDATLDVLEVLLEPPHPAMTSAMADKAKTVGSLQLIVASFGGAPATADASFMHRNQR